MSIRKYLKKTHLFLSTDLYEALNAASGDDGYVKVLFLTQLASIGALFVTEGATAHLILIYVLIPLLFLPIRFIEKSLAGFKLPFPSKFSFYNIFRNTIICRTPLFLAVVIYGADKAFLSYLYPEPILGYLHIFFYYLLAPLLAFIIATIRLAVDRPNFYFSFFRFTGPLVALNAVINMHAFLNLHGYDSLTQNYPDLNFLRETRLTTSFGAAMGYNPNLDALIYAVFLVGLLITLMSHKSKFDRLFSLPTLFILFCAILLEQSRASSLAIIFSLSFYALNWRLSITPRTIYLTLIVSSLVAGFVFILFPNSIATYFSRADYFRPELWIKFYNLSKENSFIGFGDRFIFAVPLSNGVIITHAHSILLTSLVRGGFIGLLSMLFIIIVGLQKSYQYAKHMKNAVPLCVFLTVMIAGLVDFEIRVWQAGWYLAGYWLAIGLALGADAALLNKECRIA